MAVLLRETREDDTSRIAGWVRRIRAEQYMSRIYPKAYSRGAWPMSASLLAWYVIVVDGVDVGTVWLGKETEASETAILGILIGTEDALGHGVGKTAILEAIHASREKLGLRSVRLNVRNNNPRAIRCYEQCGFVTVAEGTKRSDDGSAIAFRTMEMRLATERRGPE